LMQREFINIASHEIKSPIQALRGYSELLHRNHDKREQISQANLEVLINYADLPMIY
jgi:signal transduction histidine kinase